MKAIDFKSRTVQISTLAFLSLIWGSSFILMKRGLETFPPNEIAALRLFLVFVVLLPSTVTHFKVLKPNNRWAFLSVGILGSALPYLLFVTAQTEISSSLSGILNSLTPLFTLIFALVFFKEKIRVISVVGVSLGLIGAIGLIYFSAEHAVAHTFTVYMLLPIIASACYGLNVNIIKTRLQNINPVAVTALSFALIGPFAGVYLFGFSDFTAHIQEPAGLKSFGYISILAVLGTALAVLIFNMLIKHTTALFASSVTYLIPIIAILWGVVDGEEFNMMQLLFVGVILAGISLIKSKKKAV
ncbi:MAG: drug/metabolite transporter (DMT)-like permease [Salibacteraceae bacterium]|jgi:drug/metabolite transporter (DMT)-like permease